MSQSYYSLSGVFKGKSKRSKVRQSLRTWIDASAGAPPPVAHLPIHWAALLVNLPLATSMITQCDRIHGPRKPL